MSSRRKKGAAAANAPKGPWTGPSAAEMSTLRQETLLDDKAANAFARGFYGAIGQSGQGHGGDFVDMDSEVDVKRAFDEGKKEFDRRFKSG